MQGAGRARLVLPGRGEALVELPLAGLAALRAAAEQQFGQELRGQDYVVTDTLKVFDSDADVQAVRDGATLVLASAADGLAAPARERISFQPHPKTLTMAGEFEYFAAQGRHPFVYALAEFVDNSLRATRRNAPRRRAITISLVVSGTNPSTARGLVAIQDNGCGMNKHELADWAVMNLSMEERGAAPQEPAPAGRGAGVAGGAAAGRFLTGDLSFFGVGSKNAGFFMGSSIKVATKRADERYVHELCLTAADLEARYAAREEVYVEDMVHRNPADPSTLAPMEQPFSVARAWVAAEGEAEQEAEAAGGAGPAALGGCGPSFTRVVIGDLKPDVLRQLMDDQQGTHICQELAHLYHYYLHGEQGNRAPGGSEAVKEGRLPNGEPLPDITLRFQVDSRLVWQQRLAEVEDDMETKLLRAQQAELHFTLQVPDKGTVSGVLHYYPFQNDQETVPVENPLTSTKPASSPPFAGGRATQLGPTQHPPPRGTQMPQARGTQLGAARATQLNGGAGGAAGAGEEEGEEDEEAMGAWQAAPIFEAFWQGRLIPGARIDTLPFVEAVRQKRSAQAKDVIPDEAFRRLRGALFFGPAFCVTRNKLLFRDNLAEVLAGAVPGERQMEAKFRQWLQRCHATLDKSLRFEAPVDSRTQATLRSKLGEDTTAFERVSDGARTISKGDVVRINAKPQLVGRVLYFSIPQAVREEGAYANGRVHIELLPAEVYGAGCEKQFSLRRVEAVLSEAEEQEHVSKELLKVATSLRIEPMRFASGQAVEFSAGATLPETQVSVLSGSGQRMLKAAFSNERISVTQRLWRLPSPGDAQAAAAAGGGGSQEEAAAAQKPNKRQRKGKKGKGRQDENADENAAAAAGAGAAGSGEGSPGIPAGSELLLTVDNKTPNKETFQFARISDGLRRSGQYALEFVAAPAVAGHPPLQVVVPLVVSPGAPRSFSLSGEGKAVAALKELCLGETLPPLKVQFSDQFGNPVAMAPTATPPSLSLRLALAAPDGGMQPCEELVLEAQQAAGEDGMFITGLQLKGSEAAAAAADAEGGAAGGMALLAGSDALSHPTARQAQAAPSRQSLPVAEVQLCVSLAASPDLEPVVLPLRVRAGAPRFLRALPGHPWEDTGGAVMLQHGGSVPAFQVAAFDAWGNPTAPCADLGFEVLAKCDACSPAATKCAVSSTGVATVEGLAGGRSTSGHGPALLRLSLACSPASDHAAAAVAAADPSRALAFPVEVEPSQLPAAFQLLAPGSDEPLPMREVEGEDGPVLAAILEGVAAGSSVTGLRFVLLDESGAVSAQHITGKLTAAWKQGQKKLVWEGKPQRIPPLPVPKSVNEDGNFWLRLHCTEPPLALEVALRVYPAAAPPETWSIRLVDQLTSQNQEEVDAVRCGQPFTLQVEALDGFNNRCAEAPQPLIVVEGDGPLQYDEAAWEQGWVTQGGEPIYTVRMTVSGRCGTVRIKAHDAAGKGGASTLQPDCITADLRAGPAAQLSVDGPATLEVGTKATLPALRVKVCDAAGNPTDDNESFEVSLNSSALATDGSGRAASVAASGGNKVKLKKGVAQFKDVRVTAEEAGSYALRVQSASRKVSLLDAVLHLVMQPLNAVTDLKVVLPPVLEAGDCQAGASAEVQVALKTENGLALPAEVAAAGLVLRVMPPGGGKSDAVVYRLGGEEGEEGLAQAEDGLYAFQLADLTAAGTYSAVAEYVERRQELAGGSKKEAMLRSPTLQFRLLPGQPVAMRLEAASLPDKLAVTNGGSSKQRLMLRNAAVQLQDCFGNAAHGSGVQVRFSLRHQPGGEADGASELPDLHLPQAGGPLETDQQGRAFVGDLSIAEGTGCAASGALECELVCEALGLYPSSTHELEMDNEGWAVCWRCPVLFSDDAARFAHIEQLNKQRGQLVRRRDELGQQLGDAQRALEGAQQEQQRVQQTLASKEGGLGAGQAPSTVRAAEKALAAARRAADAAAAAEPPEALEARYGRPQDKMTQAIDHLLKSGDPGLVGVFAQLATVDDPALSAVLGSSARHNLCTLIVADVPARQRLAKLLAKQQLPAPDMLALTMLNATNAKPGDSPGFNGAGEKAHLMQRAATRGADPALSLPLPHTQAMSRLREKAEGLGMSAGEWPPGCLGYALNLVRPLHRGHRASLLYGLLSTTLVFETLVQAETYREFLSTKLRASAGVFLSLDGGCILSNGIVRGASFRVMPLEQADARFGSSGALGEDPAAAAAAEQVAALEEWVGLLRSRDEADAAVEQAQAAAEQAEAECRGQLEEVEGQIAELEAQLALGDMAAGGAGGGGSASKPASGRKRRGQRLRQEEAAEDEAGPAEEAEAVPPTEEGGVAGRKRRRIGRMRG